jgi:hypothetical protein
VDPKSIRVFPVRHHSPAAARLVERAILELRPKWVAIEGPSDSDDLVDLLLDPDTLPPVAIFAYTEEEKPRSVFYPFAAYSPEYVALRAARKVGARTRFIDIPSGSAFDEPRASGEEVPDVNLLLAERMGYRSFEELWESLFEIPGHDRDTFVRILDGYASILRELDLPDAARDKARDAFMLREIEKLGARPEELLAVMGAFHAAGFARGEVDPASVSILPEPAATRRTLIPYSFPRLSEQLGYGAGNRAPQYYQRVHDRECDFERASLETLVMFTDHLHSKGYAVSLADTIESFRLARTLARIREKGAPGLDEIRDATTACLLQGQSAPIVKFLWDIVVGRAIGQVTEKIGKNSLQEEFYRELRVRRIPVVDEPREFILHLTNATDVSSSIFLHRLRVIDVPFAKPAAQVKSRYEYLSQMREKWEVQWSPSVDAALVEKIALGSSLAQVCERLLTAKLAEEPTARGAAETLLEIAVTGLYGLYPRALKACDEAASQDADFASLAESCQKYQALISYGSSRQVAKEELSRLLARSYHRALLILPSGAQVPDEGGAAVREGVKILHEIATNSEVVDGEMFFHVADALTTSYTAHPSVAGLSLALLNLSQRIPQDRLTVLLQQRLSAGNSSINAANYLAGFLSINRLVVVKSRPLVKALDQFLQSIPKEEFTNGLPMLRRAFSGMTRGEIDYMIESLCAVHGIADASQGQQVVEGKTLEALKEADQEMKKMMDDWGGLFEP